MNSSPESAPRLRKRLFFIALFLIPSLLCLGFYYFKIREPLRKKQNTLFIRLPHYGNGSVVSGDSVFEVLNLASLEKFGLSEKFFLLSFYCNECDKTSDKVAAQLMVAQEKLSYLKKQFAIISLPSLAEDSQTGKMEAYAHKVHADQKIWQFVSCGEKDSLKTRLEHITREPVSHEKVYLIDRNGCIRGIYNGTQLKEAKRMMDETVVLAAEYGKIKNMKNE